MFQSNVKNNGAFLGEDVIHGRIEDLVSIRMDLLHGANYNDPAAFQNRSYQQIKSSCSYGCHIRRGRIWC
ncbi:cyanobactin biosynthesis system PatB/AcyB/McaB family protein [Dolichospermum compactum]|uniref:Uncharacterized protein n=1 Tax=Dolichospermum compactum NIES-806 TaxID=1973481 RepID=A0A1Z4UYG0_9CYAN|nr:cyanobactin biosynthesis system PatB/AcyB/McaB family protein [Dolichospermum compactum]BAZ84287.1 hypothetical protein NIES806_04730 [Dolichospermum compactum NIES-806]